jgi:hypothetical protein
MIGPIRGRSRAARALTGVAIAVASVTVMVAAPAGAVGLGGATPFGLTPSTSADGQPRSYFETALAPGSSDTDTVIVANEGRHTEELKISASTGVTSPNTGSAFSGYFGPCTGSGCWVTGLPAAVTLAPGAHELLPFTVTVPAGTTPRQYLAGITAEPAQAAAPVKVGGNGRASAHAVIVEQISVGVAVTVGSLADLRTSFAAPVLSAGGTGRAARLYLGLHNTGQTFSRTSGTVVCTFGGKRHSWAVTANTVLPGDTAVLPVNAPGLPPDLTVPCTVRLAYGQNQSVRSSGTVKIISAQAPKIVHVGPGVYATVPATGTPTWLVAALVAAGILVAVLTTLVVLLWRRKRPGSEPDTV